MNMNSRIYMKILLNYIFCELDCEEEEEEVTPPKKKRFGMNPEVDTKYLPDRDRDEEVVRLTTVYIRD